MGLLQYLDPFFTVSKQSQEPGEVWWVPTPEVNYVPHILDVKRATPTDHLGVQFILREIEFGKDFNGNDPKDLPVASLKIKSSEELLVTKAKLRPCVILAELSGVDIEGLPEGTPRKMAKHMQFSTYLVAPMYSVPVYPEAGTFMPSFVHRIRHMKYYHLFCIPEEGRPEMPRSIIRLDRAFVSYLSKGCKPKGQRLNDEAFDVLKAMFTLSFKAAIPEQMIETIEQLKSMLDEDYLKSESTEGP